MASTRPLSPLHPTDRILGHSPAITALRTQIRHLAPFDAVGPLAVPTVLLQGETGTGKGLVARVIHDSGPRAGGAVPRRKLCGDSGDAAGGGAVWV